MILNDLQNWTLSYAIQLLTSQYIFTNLYKNVRQFNQQLNEIIVFQFKVFLPLKVTSLALRLRLLVVYHQKLLLMYTIKWVILSLSLSLSLFSLLFFFFSFSLSHSLSFFRSLLYSFFLSFSSDTFEQIYARSISIMRVCLSGR